MQLKTYLFTVTGTREFPFDMLRYDRCWPRYERQITDLAPSIRSERYRVERTIALTGLGDPTIARWESFGWKVSDVAISG